MNSDPIASVTATEPPIVTAGDLLAWGGYAVVLIVAPLVFDSAASLSVLSQLATLILFALSYNLLLGQGGMLSFGHAVYSGLGAYFAIHTMNWAGAGGGLPLPLVPLVGGLAGLGFGVLFGYVTTKKAGTSFAMITLGIGELVHASSQMFPGFFGGEGGITSNRSYGTHLLGLSFGPQIQVYYLIAGWLLLCTLGLYAFSHTPLGRIANAVRDNAERAEFIGYDTRRVRYLVLMAASFFAGVSGGLAAINFEVVSSESLSAARSGDGLLFTFIGGVGAFAGPIVGMVVGGLLTIKLSDYTMAWQLYLGAFFVLFVMYAPGGLAGILQANWRVLQGGQFPRVAAAWFAVLAAALMVLCGSVILVELCYAAAFGSQKAALIKLLAALDRGAWALLIGAGVLLVAAGLWWLRRSRPALRERWEAVNAQLDGAESGAPR